MLSRIQSWAAERSGNIAIVTALGMVPLVGGMGIAIDFARGVSAKSHIQQRADEAALATARKGPLANDQTMFAAIQALSTQESGLRNVEITGSWTALNEFTVTISGNLPLTLATALPGVGQAWSVGTSATARYRETQTIYKPPVMKNLDPSAWDYNKIYAYCYNASTKKRSQEVAIADNAGQTYKFTMPICGADEALSYRLENVTDALKNRNWTSLRPARYNYYTDTVRAASGVDGYSSSVTDMLTTFLCPSEAKCKFKSEGGVIPNTPAGKPSITKEACAADKFMYYGWEDRTKAMGSDGDYNDIRIVIECPTVTYVGEDNARLIR